MKLSSLQKGLVLHLPLDQESYNPTTKRVTDKSAYGNHGTSANASSFTIDRMGQSDRAMVFDGDDDQINIPHDDSLNLSHFTLHTKCRVDELSRPNTLISKGCYALKTAPDDSIVFSGREFTDGTTWTEVEETSSAAIFSLCVFNGYIYAGTYPGGKIFRSQDGTTWTEVEETSETHTYSLCVFNGYIYAGTYPGGKIFRSQDGITWAEVEETSETNILSLCVFNGYIYAGTYPGGKIFRSQDGITWAEVEDLPETHIYTMCVFNGYLYAGTYSGGKIFRMGGGFDVYSDTKIMKSEYTDITATYDGTTARLYIDNVLDKEVVNAITLDTNTDDLLIGASSGSGQGGYSSTGEENMKGQIDDNRIYNRVLTESERTLLNESYRPRTIIKKP